MSSLVNLLIAIIAIGTLFLVLILYFRKPIYFEPTWMDALVTSDPNIENPQARLSTRIPSPTEEQKKQPVCILVHGFSASSYEFEEFKKFVKTQPHSILFSTIVMGGHGRDYHSFKHQTYQQWFQPIVNEFKQLQLMGYKNISIFALSAGANGVVDLIDKGQINTADINQLIFVDPFFISKSSTIHLTPFLKPIIKNIVFTSSAEKAYPYRYVNIPTDALNELHQLLKKTKVILSTQSSSNNFPKTTVFTSSDDPTSDTKSAELIQKAYGESVVTIKRYLSKHHIIINPSNKKDWVENDQKQFEKISTEILNTLSEK